MYLCQKKNTFHDYILVVHKMKKNVQNKKLAALVRSAQYQKKSYEKISAFFKNTKKAWFHTHTGTIKYGGESNLIGTIFTRSLYLEQK